MDLDVVQRQLADLLAWKAKVAPMLDELMKEFLWRPMSAPPENISPELHAEIHAPLPSPAERERQRLVAEALAGASAPEAGRQKADEAAERERTEQEQRDQAERERIAAEQERLANAEATKAEEVPAKDGGDKAG